MKRNPGDDSNFVNSGDSAHASVFTELAARTRGHGQIMRTAASRRLSPNRGGRQAADRWSGSNSAAASRGLAADAAGNDVEPEDLAAAAAAADEEADEEASLLPESKAADATDPLIEAGCARLCSVEALRH